VGGLVEADTLPWAGWVREIGHAAGWDGEVVQHIRRELGYRETVSRDEALRWTVEWERTHPPEEVDSASFDYDAENAALAGLGR
jgi:hypothetical protein